MTTQVVFKLDDTLKTKAMRKAKQSGVPFASVLKFATQAYVDGVLDVELVVKPELNAKTKRVLAQAMADYKKGKNLSPVFTNAKDAVAYLKAL
jgi:antitoxin component of RelBE/YafQ-DinJ toxin-antitoxin module